MSHMYDGFKSQVDGMNMSVDPEDLPATQFAKGFNVIIPKGVLQTRYGLTEYDLIDAAKTGTFQGGFRYQLNSYEYLVWVMSGRIYMLDLLTDTFTDVSTGSGVSLDVSARCYFVKAEKFCIIQDGINPAIILDGTSGRQADIANNEVPIGTIMAYGQGRLFLVPKTIGGQDGRRFILAGNIYEPNTPASLLLFTETQYLSGGGAFAMPMECGFIGGMAFKKNTVSGTGYGPLIVWGRTGVAAFAVDQPRETLTDVTGQVYQQGWDLIDIRQVLFQDVGSASPFAILPVNADLLFRGTKDGMRSLSTTYTDINSTLRNVSMCGEIEDIFDLGDNAMLDKVTSAFSQNRIMFTAVPDVDKDAFKAVTSLDTTIVNNVKQRLSPSFDGLWTGPRWYQIIQAEYGGYDRMFAFVRTDTGMRLVYEEPEAIDDNGIPIEARVYTRKMNFGVDTVLKNLNHVTLWLSDIIGDVTLSVYVRTDDFPFWVQLDKATTFSAPASGRPQQRNGVVFSANNIASDPVAGADGITGYVFQLALIWTGHMQVKRCMLVAESRAEPGEAASVSVTEGVALTDVGQLDLEASDYDYEW